MKELTSGQYEVTNRKAILIQLLCQLKETDRLRLFKLSFLLGHNLNGFFDFVPYKYGPYSFLMDYEIRKLIEKNIIRENANRLTFNEAYSASCSELNSSAIIEHLCLKYASMPTQDLINYVYSRYPYYAQNSLIADSKYVLEQENAPLAIYTLGYEGISIDQFLNILIKNKIKYVIDVRNNPFSYKYGFSKNWLAKFLPEFKINYKNLPGLGILKTYRKELTGNDLWNKYLELIDSYQMQEAIDILTYIPSVMICFESNIENCHRRILSNEIKNNIGLPIFDFNQESGTWIKRL